MHLHRIDLGMHLPPLCRQIRWGLVGLLCSCTGGPIPEKFALSGPSSVTNGTCSAAFSASLVDGGSATITPRSNIEVYFSLVVTGIDGGFFYSDSACANRVESITLVKDTHVVNFYFKGQAASGSMGISIDDGQGGVTPTTLSVSFSS